MLYVYKYYTSYIMGLIVEYARIFTDQTIAETST